MSGLWIIAAAILIAGTMGGIRNWLSSTDQLNIRTLIARILESIIAAGTVPLFLSIIGNEKVNAAFGVVDFESSDYQSSLLIFIGFGFIAAIYSRKFLDTLSVQITTLAEKVAEVKVEIGETRDIAEATVEGAAEFEGLSPSLSASEKKLLDTMIHGNFAIRSVEGLAKSSALSVDDVKDTLKGLEKNFFVKCLPTSKGNRWTVTDSGRSAATSS